MSLLFPKIARTVSNPSFIHLTSKNSLSCLSTYNCNVTRLRFRRKREYDSKVWVPQHNNQRPFHKSLHRLTPDTPQTEAERLSLLSAQMNIRHINENSFLSWCRNAYLSTVVAVAMMEQDISTLAQGAGFGAFLVGGMNLYWGTGCHVTNLIRLRQASGMSTFNLTLNICGSLLHCLLFSLVLVFYIGFLVERSSASTKTESSDGADISRESSV